MKRLAHKRKNTLQAALGLLMAVSLLTSCGAPEGESSEVPEDTAVSYAADIWEPVPAVDDPASGAAPERSRREIVEDMVFCYADYGREADRDIAGLLEELRSVDPDAAVRWGSIMAVWRSVDGELSIQYDVLPDGLSDTDELCIVALGFQLNPDGTMREELTERLKVVKSSAEKYPNALIVCTGGGTASKNRSATEAGMMAEWLAEQGIDRGRILVEDRSMSTAENAMYSYALLSREAPQVTQLAIVSSDYHIATGTLLFEAEAILCSDATEDRKWTVVANAAWQAPSGFLLPSFQAGALLDLYRGVN